MRTFALVSLQVALLGAAALAVGCGGGDGLFSQPDQAWDVRLTLLSENPPDCGHTIQTSRRGDVTLDGSFLTIRVYFDETETCDRYTWTLRGSFVSDTHAHLDDQEAPTICQLTSSDGLQTFRFEGLWLDFTPEMESFSGLGSCWPHFGGTEQCIGVIQLAGDRRR